MGVTHIVREETTPRAATLHVVTIDLTAPGLRFTLTAPSGPRETIRQTTLEFLTAERAQLAVNAHFFMPFPSDEQAVVLIGFAASEGRVYSAFESPSQSFAIVKNAPALNLDRSNRASLVHRAAGDGTGMRLAESVQPWTTVAGSAQIVTSGRKTIPMYADEDVPSGLLTRGGPSGFSNARSWYLLSNARTAIGLTKDRRRLVLLTVDRGGGSLGMSVSEVADVLIDDYDVEDALNLDGGGSTTMAMEDPVTHTRALVNRPAEGGAGRAVGSSLAVFAAPNRRPAAAR